MLSNFDARIGHIDLSDVKSPAAIIIFASVYATASSVPPSYPSLAKFFKEFAECEFVKKGIEMAAEYTSQEKAPLSSEPATPKDRHLKSGIFTNKTEGKKMYHP